MRLKLPQALDLAPCPDPPDGDLADLATPPVGLVPNGPCRAPNGFRMLRGMRASTCCGWADLAELRRLPLATACTGHTAAAGPR